MKYKTHAGLLPVALGIAALSLIAAHSAAAVVSIGINLGAGYEGAGNSSFTTLGASQVAGVVPQDNWNNYGTSSGGPQTVVGTGPGNTLYDSTGADTTAIAYNTSGGYYQSASGGGTVNNTNGDEILNNAGQYSNARFQVLDIPYASYDVIVYTLLDHSSTFDVDLTPYSGSTLYNFAPTAAEGGGTTEILYGTTPAPGTTGYESDAPTGYTYVAATGTSTATANAGADYAEFTNLTSSGFFVAVNNDGGFNSALDGIEIIDTSAAPEPSQIGMLALIALGLGGLLLKARKRRMSFYAA